jgi:flagellar biosynthesis/type III secretory pathway chaperone
MTDLESALDHLHANLARFTQLLEQEAKSLQDIDTDTLSNIVQEKNRASLEANQAWERLVSAAGIAPGRGESVESALAAFPFLQGKWQEIRQLAKKAEQANKTNSILIEAQMLRTRQALDVLQNAANRGTLYGADGLMENSFQSGHSLNKV